MSFAGPSPSLKTETTGEHLSRIHNRVMDSFAFELPHDIKCQIRDRVKEVIEQAIRKEIEDATRDVLKSMDTEGLVSEYLRKAA